MLHICPRLPGQSFVEPLFKEEILAFIRFLGHSAVIRKLNDVNINKLHQPWRSFAAIINKCLTGKSSGYDSLRTTNLRNEISNFQQLFDESFHKASDQDSLNSNAGGNLLERRTQDVLTIIENKSKVRNSRNKLIVSKVKSSDANSSSSFEIAKLTHAVNQQISVVTTAMTAILKQFQATPHPAFVKAGEEICVTCGGAHPYYQCLAANGKTLLEFRDNVQGYVSAAATNYNQGNFGYRPLSVANQIRPSGFAEPNVQNNQNRFSQPQGYNRGNNFNQDSSYQAPTHQNQVVPLSELEKIKKMNEINMKAMQTQIDNVKNDFFQMNTTSTLGLGPLPRNTITNSKGELKAITTRSGIVLDGPFVPMPPPFINLEEDESVEETLMDQNSCKALTYLGASINLMPLSIWKKLGLPELISTRMTLELANRAICTPAGIARDVFVLVGKFTFPGDFVIVDYESNPRVPLILGRPFLRTAHTLIDVHGEEMIFRDGDERLTLNMRHDTSRYSNQPQKESINMINIYDDSCEDFLKDLFATNYLRDIVLIEILINLNSTKDLPPPHNINPLSGSTTSFSPNHLLEELADKLPLITFLPRNDDLPFDIESDLKEIEYLLNHDPVKEIDSILEDSVDEDNLADLNDNLVDTIPEMFIDEHALDYSSPSLYDEYDDDLFEVESDTEYVYDDPFDSKEDEIKESKLLIYKLDLLRSSDFLPSPEYDSFLFEDFSEVDALSSTNNEDKDFDPPLYELPFHKEVLGSKTLLSFSSKNEEKFSNLGFSLLKEFILLFS
nr:hypothetical protein [Tanacetum cinerariifolium]